MLSSLEHQTISVIAIKPGSLRNPITLLSPNNTRIEIEFSGCKNRSCCLQGQFKVFCVNLSCTLGRELGGTVYRKLWASTLVHTSGFPALARQSRSSLSSTIIEIHAAGISRSFCSVFYPQTFRPPQQCFRPKMLKFVLQQAQIPYFHLECTRDFFFF